MSWSEEFVKAQEAKRLARALTNAAENNYHRRMARSSTLLLFDNPLNWARALYHGYLGYVEPLNESEEEYAKGPTPGTLIRSTRAAIRAGKLLDKVPKMIAEIKRAIARTPRNQGREGFRNQIGQLGSELEAALSRTLARNATRNASPRGNNASTGNNAPTAGQETPSPLRRFSLPKLQMPSLPWSKIGLGVGGLGAVAGGAMLGYDNYTSQNKTQMPVEDQVQTSTRRDSAENARGKHKAEVSTVLENGVTRKDGRTVYLTPELAEEYVTQKEADFGASNSAEIGANRYALIEKYAKANASSAPVTVKKKSAPKKSKKSSPAKIEAPMQDAIVFAESPIADWQPTSVISKATPELKPLTTSAVDLFKEAKKAMKNSGKTILIRKGNETQRVNLDDYQKAWGQYAALNYGI